MSLESVLSAAGFRPRTVAVDTNAAESAFALRLRGAQRPWLVWSLVALTFAVGIALALGGALLPNGIGPSAYPLFVTAALAAIAAFGGLDARRLGLLALVLTLWTLASAAFTAAPQAALGAFFVALVAIAVTAMAARIERRERQIARQRQRLRRLQARSDRLSEFVGLPRSIVAGVASSLRQDVGLPLASAQSHLRAMATAIPLAGGRAGGPSLVRLRRCTKAAADGLDDLLAPADGAGMADLRTARVDLRALMLRVYDVHIPHARDAGVELRFSTGSRRSLLVRSDASALARVLDRLIDNAVRYTAIAQDRPKRVLIGVTRLQSQVRIDVVDTGVGIAPDAQSRIFEPGYRTPEAAARTRGYGHGLTAVSAEITRLPEHTLRLRSREHRGTRVQLLLPVA